MGKKSFVTGECAFDEFYQASFGSRWSKLRSSLMLTHPYHEITVDLHTPYYLDKASLIAVQALDLHPGQQILDLCAAPGGKALLIAQATGKNACLTVNERSVDRFHRLRRTMDLLKTPPQITFTRSDARRYSMLHPGLLFDRILLDAPCSSEAHVLKSPQYLSQWSTKRPKRLAIEQIAMLCQALDLCRVGGKIVYSTCSINGCENDGVIEKMLKKRAHLFSIEPANFGLGEKTTHGWQVWPDRHQQGPLYIAILKREKNP
ncbi:MAG: RsmB/NOP family class I SAM-dependent RNA methyltransferase [Spirochaetia bacterium]